jgi:hypothetical protein
MMELIAMLYGGIRTAFSFHSRSTAISGLILPESCDYCGRSWSRSRGIRMQDRPFCDTACYAGALRRAVNEHGSGRRRGRV